MVFSDGIWTNLELRR